MRWLWGVAAVAAALVAGCAAPLFDGSFTQTPSGSGGSAGGSANAQQVGVDLHQLSEQVGALSRSVEVMDGRLSRLESQTGAASATSDELTALRRDIQQLRAERDTLKREITDDLAARVEKIAARQQAEARNRSAPVASAAAASAPAPRTAGKTAARSGYEHKVEKGQTLSTIAKGYNTTVDAIIKANKISNPSAIRVGQVLFIPD